MSRKRKYPICIQCGKHSAKYPKSKAPMFCCLQCALDYGTMYALSEGWTYDKDRVQWTRPEQERRSRYIPEPSGYVAAISDPAGVGMGKTGEAEDA